MPESWIKFPNYRQNRPIERIDRKKSKVIRLHPDAAIQHHSFGILNNFFTIYTTNNNAMNFRATPMRKKY